MTGKPAFCGGSPLRPEATGYGLVYMAKIAAEKRLRRSLEGARCAISGSGNVAQYAARKLLQFGAKVITVSDTHGVLVFENGMSVDDWGVVAHAKQIERKSLSSVKDKVSGQFTPNRTPWSINVPYDFAFPCATQNELNKESVELLLSNGCQGVFEGANLPTNLEGQKVLRSNPEVLYIPGKAANAGGVGVSGFEMSQNSQHLTWALEKVDAKLQMLMENIYQQIEEAKGGDGGTMEEGANRAGFLKVVKAMEDLGWIY